MINEFGRPVTTKCVVCLMVFIVFNVCVLALCPPLLFCALSLTQLDKEALIFKCQLYFLYVMLLSYRYII